jgi:hypothetical protein
MWSTPVAGDIVVAVIIIVCVAGMVFGWRYTKNQGLRKPEQLDGTGEAGGEKTVPKPPEPA